MTYIEFFDKTAPENICASLASPPDRVVLVGDKGKVLREHARRYRDVFLTRGHDVQFLTKTLNRNDLGSILDALTELIGQYDDCIFDLTGGEELYLVAVGILFERYRDRGIRMHRFNIQRGTVIDCDQDGKIIAEGIQPELTVEENIRIYGGDIIYDSIRPGATCQWEMDGEFAGDILAMWDICRADPRDWNSQINMLSRAAELGSQEGDPLCAAVTVQELEDSMNRRIFWSYPMMQALQEQGMLTQCALEGGWIRLSFKNKQVKRCLTKAGQILEMLIYVLGLSVKDKDGTYTYCDVMTGVCIDWDGKIHPEGKFYDTENEVDVILMHGIVPVFVSCKNGMVETEELYKLNTVAERFGGRYAKKILIATALESNGTFDDYFRQRAKDMDIQVVEGLQEMTGEELRDTIRNLWTM